MRRLRLRREREFRKGTEAVGGFGKTEKDREAHKLEPLNEEDNENCEWLALMSHFWLLLC